jgi:hypothetical protein
VSGERAIRLFVHVEEPSIKAALEVLLPVVIGSRAVYITIIDHGSKQGLLTNLPMRLQGYGAWPDEDIRVLVVVDRDNDDCVALKRRLEAAALAAALPTKTAPGSDGRFRVVNRIVVEELEAWFLGDPSALCAAYPGVPSSFAAKAKYRDPDGVRGGTWEALAKLLSTAGHYRGSGHLPKIEVARRVSAHMTTESNRSHSFQVFVGGLQALLA